MCALVRKVVCACAHTQPRGNIDQRMYNMYPNERNGVHRTYKVSLLLSPLINLTESGI